MDYHRRAPAVEAAPDRRHHVRRGATPDRRYSSSSDEGGKAKDRVPNSNARRKASGGGGERWTSRNVGNTALTSSNPHFTPSGGIGGSQNLTSEMSNGSLHNRLYSYLSGSEDEAEENRRALAQRSEFGLQRRNSTSSPVDVSSPSWVRSPSESCDSESDHDGMVPPHLIDHATSVDGTSRFGENIYSRIKMDSGKTVIFFLLLPVLAVI